MLRYSVYSCLWLFLSMVAQAQPGEKIKRAYQRFTADAQMKHAISSLLVVDAGTGKTIFTANEQAGLAPASTLKVVTAAAALAQLGPDFRYKTPVLYAEAPVGGILKGNLVVKGTGDPTTGSWRYVATRANAQLHQLSAALQQAGIQSLQGSILLDNAAFGSQAVSGGWTFDDIGNYYGAGAQGFNWYENQYDLVLVPGTLPGQPVAIAGTRPVLNAITLQNELKTGAAGSGDQAIIYPDRWPGGTVRGTVPAGVKEFVISGSVLHVPDFWQKALQQFGTANGSALLQGAKVLQADESPNTRGWKTLTVWESPSLDSIVYFFLQKSVNLYGEALARQLALRAGKQASPEEGVKAVRQHWKERGIENGALRIVDGSGLSPHNRLTTRTLVQVLQHARNSNWFPAFYEGLPVINGIKMKSGSISGVRGYTGYVTSSDGKTYIFAFIVNNFEGSSAQVMQKMFEVLNALK